MSAAPAPPAELVDPTDTAPKDDVPDPAETYRAGTNFIVRLPDELLCEIFWFLDHGDRISSTHVCRTWRHASLGCPGQLWNEVQSQKCKPGVFAALMDRTQTAPVTVTVTIADDNAEEVASSLKKHLHHCSVLSLHVKEPLSDDNEVLLGRALSGEAPVLEKLILMDIFCAISAGFKGTVGLFGASAPRLSCVKVYARIDEYAMLPAFSGVRQLLYAPYEGLFDAHQYQHCLQLSPAIEDLSIQLRDGLFDARDSADDSAEPFRLPAHIRSLSITPTAAFDPTLFLDRIDHWGVPRLNVLFLDEPLAEMAERLMVCAVERLHIVSMVVDAWEYDHLARIQLVSNQGLVRDFFDVPLCICSSITTSLTDLRITEVEWLRMHHWPCLPALTSLTLYLVTVIYILDHKDYDSILFTSPSAESTGVLDCPRLQTLIVSTRRRGDAALMGFVPALGPETIMDFITHRLRFQRPRIPKLVMNGVSLMPHFVVQVAELLDLVQDIEYGSGHSRPPDLPSEDLLHWV